MSNRLLSSLCLVVFAVACHRDVRLTGFPAVYDKPSRLEPLFSELEAVIETAHPTLEVLRMRSATDDWEVTRHAHTNEPIALGAQLYIALRHAPTGACYFAAPKMSRAPTLAGWGPIELAHFSSLQALEWETGVVKNRAREHLAIVYLDPGLNVLVTPLACDAVQRTMPADVIGRL